jgi:uncharacterized protein (TIGR00251 family)
VIESGEAGEQGMIHISVGKQGLTIPFHVLPRASQTKIVGEIDGAVKIRVAAPPVEGAANLELIKFVSKLLDIPRNKVEIASGAASRHKLLRVTGVTMERCTSAFQRIGLWLV